MKLPKKLFICGKTYRIILDKSIMGGEFSVGRSLIKIGNHPPELTQHILIHEITEIILAEKNFRYKKEYEKPTDNDYHFILDHEQFDDLTRELSYCIRQIYD